VELSSNLVLLRISLVDFIIRSLSSRTHDVENIVDINVVNIITGGTTLEVRPVSRPPRFTRALHLYEHTSIVTCAIGLFMPR